MKPRSYTSEGIVLARKKYGEADRIVSVYSKTNGRVSLIAKGVRRPKSRKRGHIEVFSHVNYQAVSGRGIDIMTEAVMIDDFKDIRKSLKKISLAYYLMEVVGRITHESERSDRLFELILNTLTKLKSAKLLKKLRLEFISNILILLGYWPQESKLKDPDAKLDEVIERQLYSKRVGKIVTSSVN